MTEATFGQIWWQILLALLISYLCGNINFAIELAQIKGFAFFIISKVELEMGVFGAADK